MLPTHIFINQINATAAQKNPKINQPNKIPSQKSHQNVSGDRNLEFTLHGLICIRHAHIFKMKTKNPPCIYRWWLWHDKKCLVLRCAVFWASVMAVTTANTFTCLFWEESEFGETLPEHCKVSILGSDKLKLHNRIF